MKERSVWSRLIAMMLAVAMVLTSQPVNVLAEEEWTFIGGAPNTDGPTIDEPNADEPAPTAEINLNDKDRTETHEFDIKEWITKDTELWASVDGGNTYTHKVTQGEQIEEGTPLQLKLKFKVPDNVWLVAGDTLTFQLPPDQFEMALDQGGPVKVGDREVGNYTIDASGNVTLHITDEAYVKDIQIAGGSLDLFGSLGKGDSGSTGGNVHFDLGDFNLTVDVEPKPEVKSNGVDVHKSSPTEILDENGKIIGLRYKVSVTAQKGNTDAIKNLHVKDVLSEDKEFAHFIEDKLNVKVLIDGTSSDIENGQIHWKASVNEDDDSVVEFDFTIDDPGLDGKDPDAKHFTFTYDVYLDDDFFFIADGKTSISSTLDNTVTVLGDNFNPDTDDSSYTHSQSDFLKKELQRTEDGKHIRSTIIVNEECDYIPNGWTLKDNLIQDSDEHQYLDGTLIFECYDKDGNKIEERSFTEQFYEKDQKTSFDYPLPEGSYKYVITYEAKVTDDDRNHEYENNASLYWKGHEGPGFVKEPGIRLGDYAIHKKVLTEQVDIDGKKIPWEVTLICYNGTKENGMIPKDAYFYDWANVPAESKAKNIKHKVNTEKDNPSNASNPKDIFEFYEAGKTEPLQLGIDYEIKQLDFDDDNGNGVMANRLKVKFLRDVQGPVTVRGYTYASFDGEPGAEQVYRNFARLRVDNVNYDRTTSADYSYTPGGRIDKYAGDEKGEHYYDEKTATLIWYIDLNKSTETWNVSEENPLIVTDVLPEGMELATVFPEGYKYDVPVALERYKSNGTLENWGKNRPDDYDYVVKGQTVTCTIKKWASWNCAYRLIIVAHITDEKLKEILSSGGNHNFTNKASAALGGHSVGSDTDSRDVTCRAVDKTSTETADDVLYTVEVNPSGITFGGRLDLTDIMSKNLVLKESTIEVIGFGKDGNPITIARTDVKPSGSADPYYTCTYDYNSNTLAMNLPDGMKLVITYHASVDGVNGKEESVSNRVHVQVNGASVGEDNDEGSFKVKDSGASLFGGAGILVKKLNTVGKSLEGAEFEWGTVTLSNTTNADGKYTVESTTSKGTVTTDSFGQIQLTQKDGLKYNEWYYVKELTAPAGYVKGDEIQYFCIANEESVPDLVDGRKVANGREFEFKNEGGSLEVEKKVTGENAPADSDTLYTITVTGPGNADFSKAGISGIKAGEDYTISGTGDLKNVITLHIKKDTHVSLTGIPLGTYTVEETETQGATTVTYEAVVGGESAGATGTVTLDDESIGEDGKNRIGKVTVTNIYEDNVGSLSVTKSVEGDTQPTDGNTPYKIQITQVEGGTALSKENWEAIVEANSDIGAKLLDNGLGLTFEITKDETVTLGNLPEGDYWVQELSGADGQYTPFISSVSGEGSSIDTENGRARLHVIAGSTASASVTVTNIYPNKSSVTVKKVVKGTPGSEDQNKKYKITITGFPGSFSEAELKILNGRGGNPTYFPSDKKWAISMSFYLYAGETARIDGLQTGFLYRIWEEEGSYNSDIEITGTKDTLEGDQFMVGENDSIEWEGWIPHQVPGEEYAPEVTVTNTYSSQTSVQFQVKKSVADQSISAAEKSQFTFDLYETDNDFSEENEVKLGSSVTFNGSGAGVFDVLSYATDATDEAKKTGDHYYVLRENATSGYTSSPAEYRIHVQITENENGVLQKKVWTVAENGEETPVTEANGIYSFEFTNTRNGNADLELQGSKTITGRGGDLAEEYAKFEFGVYTDKACPSALTDASSGQKITAKAGNDGKFKFNFHYTMEDLKTAGNVYSDTVTKTYYIKEMTASGNGYTSDPTIYKVEVTITDNGTGALVTSHKITKLGDTDAEAEYEELAFENTYDAVANDTLTGKKKVENANLKPFQFTLYEVEDGEETLATSGYSEESWARTSENPVSSSGEDGSFVFNVHFRMDDLAIRENEEIIGYGPKDFTFRVKEVPEAGYTNDGTYYEITYKNVKDAGDGTLEWESREIRKYTGSDTAGTVISDETLTFVNTYAATGETTIKVKKTLNGNVAGIGNEQFSFTLKNSENNTKAYNQTVRTKQQSATVGENGTATATDTEVFPPLTYSMEDLRTVGSDGTIHYERSKTFTYELEEDIPNPEQNGYAYDGATYLITVTVEDNGDGTLKVTKTIRKRAADGTESVVNTGEGREEAPLEFTNTYSISGNLTFQAEKTLRGQSLSDGQFTFTLSSEASTDPAAEKDDQEKADQIVTNKGGTATFAPLTYTQDDVGKTYRYVLEESQSVSEGYDVKAYQFDSTRYVFDVTVKDVDGEIQMDVADRTVYPEGTPDDKKWKGMAEGSTVVEANFVNTYEAKGGFALNATKSIAPEESNASKAGYDFDVYELVDGKLSNVLFTGTSNEEGVIGFDEFEEDYYRVGSGADEDPSKVLGEHVYIVQEHHKDSDGMMTYSDQVYRVEVYVRDNGDGTLIVTGPKTGDTYESDPTITDITDALKANLNAYGAEGSSVEEMVFINTYLAKGTLTLTLDKSLTGYRKNDIIADEFAFTATQVDAIGTDGNPVQNADGEEISYSGTAKASDSKYDENGTYSTTAEIAISYTQEDIGKTYYYRVQESSGNTDSVTVDKSVYYVQVDVSDSDEADHTLKFDVTYCNEEGEEIDKPEGGNVLSFTNDYEATGSFTLSGTKAFDNTSVNPSLEGYKFEVKEGETVVATGTSDADGNIEFTYGTEDDPKGGIAFTLNKDSDEEKVLGDHTYVVTEVDDPDDHVTPVMSSVTFHVTVEDDGNGNLIIKDRFGNVLPENLYSLGAFVNHYSATGSAKLEAGKVLTGHRGEPIDPSEFTFVAELIDQTTGAVATDDLGKVKESYPGAVEPDEGITDDGNRTAAVTFNLPDQYDEDDVGKSFVYKITEIRGEDSHIEYSNAEVYAKVTVSLNQENGTDLYDGSLKTEVAYFSDADCSIQLQNPAFTNGYKASGAVVLETSKQLTGRELGNEFLFQVTEYDAAEAKWVPVTDMVTNAGTKVILPEISYDQDDIGTHIYRIVEQQGTDQAITYDNGYVEVTVTVSDKEVDGKAGQGELEVQIGSYTYYDASGNLVLEQEHIVGFENSYTANGNVTFQGTKTLTGRLAPVGAGEFSFTVYNVTGVEGYENMTEEELEEYIAKDAQGNPIKGVTAAGRSTVETDGVRSSAAQIVFDAIHYTQDDLAVKDEEGNIIYEDKTFTYFIKEDVPADSKVPGVSYSTQSFTVKVTVKDQDEEGNAARGVLTATPVYDEEGIAFVNEYHANGSLQLNARKELSGAALTEGQFSFELKDASGNVLQTVSNNADGSITFTPISYDEKDIGHQYYYTVSEKTDASNNGKFSQDHTIYTVFVDVELETDETTNKVVVDGENSAVLKVTSYVVEPENGAEIVFHNTYLAQGSAQLNVNKAMTGNRAKTIGAGEFGFTATEVTEVAGSPVEKDGKIVSFSFKTENADENGTASAAFEIPYDQDDVGDHYYRIVEDAFDPGWPFDSSVEMDDTVYYAKVVVTDNEDHTLGTTVTYYGSMADAVAGTDPLEDVTYENNYTAQGSLAIHAEKTLTGNRMTDLQPNEFIFDIWRQGEDSGNPLSTGSNDEDGNIAFNPALSFTQEDIGKDITFVVREQEKAADGVKNAADRMFTVRVEDAGRGHLSISAVESDGSITVSGSANYGYTGTITGPFVNEYQAEGSAVLNVNKILEGGRGTAIGADEFDFTAKLVRIESTDADGQLKSESVTGKDINGVCTENTSNEVSVSFEDAEALAYDQDDIGKSFIYAITETKGEDDHIIYDETTIYAKVSVEDGAERSGDKGVLNVEVKYFSDLACENELAESTFTNKYTAEGNVTLTVAKTLIGRTHNDGALVDGEFSFQLFEQTYDDQQNLVETPVKDAQGNDMIASNTGGTVTFPAITYSQDDQGSHDYVIRELNLEAPGMTYDTGYVRVSVTVEDENGNGELTVSESPYEYLDANGESVEGHTVGFENTYEANGSVTFQGRKVLTGRSNPTGAQAGEFSFSVYDVTDIAETDIPAELTDEWRETNAAMDAQGNAIKGVLLEDGQIRFGAITYNQNQTGDHKYLVVEDIPAEAERVKGVEYSAQRIVLTVNVTDTGNGGDNALEAVVTDYPDGGMVFTNNYTAEAGITLEGTKSLTGNRVTEIGADEFHFTVTEDGEEVATGSTLAGGEIQFTEIRYTQDNVGTHTYVLSEVVPAEEDRDPSITYSAQTFTVTVAVADNGDGSLTVTPTYPEDGVTFVNDYTANGTFTINNVQKTLTGADLAAGQFSFTLTAVDADGNVLTGEEAYSQTVTNAADGSVAFDPIAYTQDDIGRDFIYTVSEASTGAEGFTFDDSVYTVTVHVADNGDGTLDVTAETTLDGEAVETAAFSNTFAGSVTLRKLGTAGTPENPELLAGAAFQLYYQTSTVDGDNVWMPYNNASYVTGIDGTLTVGGLAAGDYYFVETQAPTGYAITEDADGNPMQYPFTIGSDASEAVNVSLDVTNTPNTEDTTLVVTKQLVYENELWNAVDETFYVALFSDEALTDRVTDIQPIVFQDNNTSSTTFTDLEYGRTYYVGETNDEGVVLNLMGGVIASGQSFSVDFNGDNAATVTEGSGTQVITFRNVFTEIPPEFYREGNLTITKQLLGMDGVEKPSNKTFYAGIFSDAAYTQLSTDVDQNIVELALGGAATASNTVRVTVPMDGGTTTVYVTEVDKDGRPVAGAASFQYDVTVEGTTVTMDLENLSGETVITNQEREETETEFESELESEFSESHGNGEEESNSVVPTSTKSVKTGDETPLGLYIGLMAAAAILILLLLLIRRKSRRKA